MTLNQRILFSRIGGASAATMVVLVVLLHTLIPLAVAAALAGTTVVERRRRYLDPAHHQARLYQWIKSDELPSSCSVAGHEYLPDEIGVCQWCFEDPWIKVRFFNGGPGYRMLTNDWDDVDMFLPASSIFETRDTENRIHKGRYFYARLKPGTKPSSSSAVCSK